MKIPRYKDLLLFENDDYALLNKPPYYSTLDERLGTRDNLLQITRAALPDAQFCHRLDKETSGIIAVAKHPEAYRQLSMQFERREVEKTYHAVAQGVHEFRDTEVNRPLKTTSNGLARIADREGKPAQTFFSTLRTFRQFTVLRCKPVTGRLHQIRVHASYLKAPLVSDPQYGGKMLYLSAIKRNFNLKKYEEEQPLMQRVALHAAALKFRGLDGKPIEVSADYPKDMRALMRQLEIYNA